MAATTETHDSSRAIQCGAKPVAVAFFGRTCMNSGTDFHVVVSEASLYGHCGAQRIAWAQEHSNNSVTGVLQHQAIMGANRVAQNPVVALERGAHRRCIVLPTASRSLYVGEYERPHLQLRSHSLIIGIAVRSTAALCVSGGCPPTLTPRRMEWSG